MADERDPQISQRYRALGREEPPPELDRAILAAARRASRRHRWYASLAAAAVLIFAVAIVVQIERQPPDQMPVSAPSTSTAAQPTQDKIAPQRRAAPQFTPEPPPRAEQAPAAPPAPAPEPSANIGAPMAGAAADAQRNRTDEPHAAETRAAPQPQRSTASRRSATTEAQANLVETREQWLARIARMRDLGQNEDADKELARFRERYPDYRIPDAMAKKVEKRAPAAPAQ